MSNKEQQQLLNEGAFHQNSPRPPVPGEEKSHFLYDWGPQTSKQKSMEDAKFIKPNSPLPKRNLSLPSGKYLFQHLFVHVSDKNDVSGRDDKLLKCLRDFSAVKL